MANVIEFTIRGVNEASGPIKKVSGSVVSLTKQAATLAAGTAAMAAGIATIVNRSSSAARELSNLSFVAGANVEKFQEMAFGAQRFGVEQDKLADILKDTNDKIGDFLEAGSGPMVDFFENVAPLVGVTADNFKNLSGPQSLQLYVNSLEKANLSQAKMTFYMEAIGNDATALLPLLRDNGSAMAGFAADAQDLNVVLSEMEVEKLKQAGDAFLEARKSSEALTNKISAQLAPIIVALSKQFRAFVGDSNAVGNAVDKAFGFIVKSAGFVANSLRGIQVVLKSLEVAFYGLQTVSLMVLEAIVSSFDSGINAVKATINSTIDGINKLPGVDIDRLVIGDSAATQRIKGWRQGAVDSLNGAAAEWHGLMMKPLPSEALEAWVDTAIESSEMVAATVIQTNAAVTESNAAAAEAAVEQTAIQLKRQQEKMAEHRAIEIEMALQQSTSLSEIFMLTMESVTSNALAIGERVSGLISNTFEQLTTGIGDAVAGVIVDGESLAESMMGVMKSVAKTVISDLIAMGVQRMLTAILFRKAAASEASSQLASGLAQVYTNAFASTAAIPIIGPALAPGVAAGSLAAASAGATAGGASGAALGTVIAGARADGGPVGVGQTYLVGERGPELFSPRSNGTIIPNESLSGTSSGVNIQNLTIHLFENATNADMILKMPSEQIKEVVAEKIIPALDSLARRGIKPQYLEA